MSFEKLQMVFAQISEKDWIVLNPWFSGRGAFPGLMDMITSRPETTN